MVPTPDAGSRDSGVPFDGGDYDPVAGNPFDGPISLDDERIARLDGSGLRAGSAPCREPIRGRVFRVIDGDTVRFTASDGSLEATVRFIGVDTPEVGRDGMPSDCYGDEATVFTEQLLGHDVWLSFDTACTDRFDRLLAYVHIGGGSGDMWQRQLLQRGFARVLTVRPDVQFRATFESDESAAQAADVGLWRACF